MRRARVLARGAQAPVHGQGREEGADLLLAHGLRVALAVVEDELADPVDVGLLGPGAEVAGADRQPQPSTSTWAKGQIVVDQYELGIAPDAPPDVYEIEVGLYLPETGDRLDLLDQDGRLKGNRVLLSKVRVE